MITQEPLKLNKEALSALISANVTVFAYDYGTKTVKASWLKRRKQIINSVDDVDEYKNYHIITGDNNILDIDLDCMEAIKLAPYFLPATNMKYGRQSNPTSHWLFKVIDLTKKHKSSANNFTESFRNYNNQALSLPKYQRKPAGKKDLVGVDIFVHWNGEDPNKLALKLQNIQLDDIALNMINNTGIKVWPNGFSETFFDTKSV